MSKPCRFNPLMQLTLLTLCALFPAMTQAQGDSRDMVNVEIVPRSNQVAPGSDLPVAVVFDMPDGWHIYANEGNVPDYYFKTVVQIESSDPSRAVVHDGFTQWPEVHPLEFPGEGELDFFIGRAAVYVPVTIPNDAQPGTVTLTVKPAFQTCNDFTCLQPTPHPKNGENDPDWQAYGTQIEIEIVPLGEATTTTDIPPAFADFDASVFGKIHAGETAPDVVNFDLFGVIQFDLDVAARSGLILLMLVAAVGGFLLNLTPCVLPVIPLKIMSLANTAGNRSRTLALGFMMYLGIVAFWMALGLAIAMISAFTATNQLFQEPWFNIALGAFIAIMAVGMCGVFAIRLPNAVYKVSPKHDSMAGSFGFGVMTAVLSTPCTAPFMGTAAAWAAGQDPGVVLLVFAAIANGMALPYLILAAFPALVQKMPKSGPASEVIKQVMGLLMLAAAAYFVGVGLSGLTAQVGEPPSRFYIWVVAAFCVMAGGWLAYKTFSLAKKTWPKATFGTLGIVMIAAAAYLGMRLTDKGPIDWVYYTPERFETAKAEGNIVVMEFTAEWCLNCKALEESVLRQESIVQLLHADDVVPIKVDLTGNNDVGNAMLKAVDRLTIPLLVIFTPDGTEVFKGDFYTPQQVVDAVNDARQRAGSDEAIASRE